MTSIAVAVAPIVPARENPSCELPVTYRGLVYPWHCDHMGHMNVMWYTGKFDEASWSFLALFGLTAAFLREHGRRMAAVEQVINYRQELFAGDAVTIVSAMLEVREKSIRFAHRMYKEGSSEAVASCNLVGVHLDAQTRRACALPAAMVDRARGSIAA